MALRVSGQHMEIGESFRARIEERIKDAVTKYFTNGYTGHVTVVKSGSGYSADCVLFLDSGAVLQTAGKALDPQSAFDAAAERIETRLRRYKRRLKSHKQTHSARNDMEEYSYQIMEAMPEEEEELPANYAPTIVAETVMALRIMSVADAVLELDLKDNPVLLFRNAADEKINIVYRRADNNIGWFDPLAITIKQ